MESKQPIHFITQFSKNFDISEIYITYKQEDTKLIKVVAGAVPGS